MKFQVVQKVEMQSPDGESSYKLVLHGIDNRKKSSDVTDIRGRMAYSVSKQVYDSVKLGQDAEVEVRFIPVLRAVP